MDLVYFINPPVQACGVHQYGRCLYDVLMGSKRFDFVYAEITDKALLLEEINDSKPYAIIYNHAPLIPGWMNEAPLATADCHQVLVYHDGDPRPGFDAILFSDPTRPDHEHWHHIGRPLPYWNPVPCQKNDRFTIGLHGFGGAWSVCLIGAIIDSFSECRIRMHLPYAAWTDGEGRLANSLAQECLNMLKGKPNISVEIRHQFMPSMVDLLHWLSGNDINCYVRDKVPWRGVSSALDAALAVQRPIAINKCEGFRHLFHVEPSVCIEDRNIFEIYESGESVFDPVRKAWSAKNVRDQVEKVLVGLS